MTVPDTMLQMQSTVHADGRLELGLVEVPVPRPAADEVLVRVEAAPINPSDLGVMFGTADLTAVAASEGALPGAVAPIPEKLRAPMAAREGQPIPVGNEGAGVVVAAGDAPAAQELVGRTVAMLGGAMYAQYRCVRVSDCLVLNEGTTPVEGASCFVNPLTALGMTETMRLEGHVGLVHTAAASNLGQMLNRICLADGIPLVNIVRRDSQAQLLRDQGAAHVCNAADADFRDRLTDALEATGATLAFDAIGGGELASTILSCMERAALRTSTGYNRYGSDVHKQVYVYGGLDRGPTIVRRDFGMAWGMGGWLLPPFLQRVGPEVAGRMRQRVADELGTTFRSHYSREVSLREAVSPEQIAIYAKQATGEKYLVRPQA